MPRVLRWFTPLLAAPLLASCAAQTPRSPDVRAADPTTIGAAATTNQTSSPRGDLVAMLDGVSVNFAELRPALVEAAGVQVLRDQVVDTRLAARLRAAAIAIDPAMIANEERILLETLDPASDARARELLLEIRSRQSLGPTRYDALLRRNAGLRALVAREVTLDEAGVENIFDAMHGPKRTARIAVLSSLADAERLAKDAATAGFATLAAERSTDASAARGGLLSPIARRDPSYPETVRAAIFTTEVGRVSAPVLDGSRFFVVEVVREAPGDGVTRESARAECERLLRLSRERLLMDALARELASLEGVTVFDRAFDRAAAGSSAR